MLQSALEQILKDRVDQVSTKLQLKEDKQDKMLNENLDSSQTKENFYKEEYHKQLKLLDHSQQIPSDSMHAMTIQPDSYENNSLSMNDEDKRKYLQTVNNVNDFLAELVGEQKKFNYSEKVVAQKLSQTIGQEMKEFSAKLLEKNKNRPNMPLGGEALQSLNKEANSKQKKDEKSDKIDAKEQVVSQKLEWIRLKTKINSISDLNPLTLNMEQIYTLPQDIIVSDNGEISKQSTEEAQKEKVDVEKEIERKKAEIRVMVMSDSQISDKKRLKMDKFIEELFSSQMEIESWVSAKESIVPSINTQLNSTNANMEPMSHQSLNLEQVEISDLNFFRDLGPLARKLNLSKQKLHNFQSQSNSQDVKLQRKIQKKVFNHYIEIEPNQANLNEDMHLLALSGLVPLDKCKNLKLVDTYILVIKRMNNLNKWDLNFQKDEHFLDDILQTSPSSGSADELGQSQEQVIKENISEQNRLKPKILLNSNTMQQDNGNQDEDDDGIQEDNSGEENDGNVEVMEFNQNQQDIDDDKRTVRSELSKNSGKTSHAGKLQQPAITTSNRENSYSQKIGGNFSEQTQRALQNLHKKGQFSNFNNNNDLSVISEQNQSAGESMLTHELLKSFINNKNASPSIKLGERQISKESKESNINIMVAQSEQQIIVRLNTVDDLIKAKKQLEQDQEMQAQSKKQQNIKNIERMRAEINKRIEQLLLEIISILDQQQALGDDDDLISSVVISNETIMKGSIIQQEDIDEQVKAKFLTRLVREYRKNRERQKQELLKEQMEKEIEENMSKRFPSLYQSPDAAVVQRSLSREKDQSMRNPKTQQQYSNQIAFIRSRGQSNSTSPPLYPKVEEYTMGESLINSRQIYGRKKQDYNNMQETVRMDEVSQMKQGWGVNTSYRQNQQHFKNISRNTMQKESEFSKTQKQISEGLANTMKQQSRNAHNGMLMSQTLNQQRYVNNFKPKKQQQKLKDSMHNNDLDIDDNMQPRKQPMRENHIRYTPSSALMNMKKSKNSDASLKNKTKKKNIQQDASPGHQWIGGEEAGDSDFDDHQWIDQSNYLNA